MAIGRNAANPAHSRPSVQSPVNRHSQLTRPNLLRNKTTNMSSG